MPNPNLTKLSTPDPNTRLAADLEQARTCSEVAALLFPQSALTGPAFLEGDVSGLNEQTEDDEQQDYEMIYYERNQPVPETIGQN
jgi:hypothetical protein